MALVFPIITQFDDKAVKKADDAFGKLAKRFAAVFSVTAVTAFGKASVKAFMEAEKEAAALRAQLEAVNLGFASDLLNDYIDNIALLSGKTGGDLTRAFVTLSQATGDATTAQELLNAALDISAGTGKDLQSVSYALQRAYKGEVTALAKLKIGLTATELKGKKFNDVLADLQKRFEGAGAAAADTFAGKLDRLKEAVDQAQEAFGKGLVSGLEESGMSIDELQIKIISFGESLGKLAADTTEMADAILSAFKKVEESPITQGLMNVFDFLTRQVGFVITGEVEPSFKQGDLNRKANAERASAERSRSAARTRKELVREEKKITQQREKQLKLTEKDAATAKILSKAKATFDMEQIQIAAALQGKISEEERIRLKLMQAIIEENSDEADRLMKRLKEVQDETAALANKLTGLKAGDPFSEWQGYFDAIMKINPFEKWPSFLQAVALQIGGLINQVLDLQAQITASLTAAQNASAKANAAVEWAKANRIIAYTEAANAAANAAANSTASAASATTEAAAAVAAATTPSEVAAANAFAEAAAAAAAAAVVETEAAIASAFAAATLAANDAAMAEYEAALALIDAGLASEVNVTVNVEGSVVTETDLVTSLTDAIYVTQKGGTPIVYRSLAI